MVALKRSRVSSFSILGGEAGGVSTRKSQSPEMRRNHHPGRRSPDLPTVSSPDFPRDTRKESGWGRIENFLEQCGFCKKKLGQNHVVFMYGNLGAFCSPECRGKQMACDKFMEFRKRMQSKKGRTCCNKMNGSEDLTVMKLETPAAPSFHI